jgi:hypothetical protein
VVHPTEPAEELLEEAMISVVCFKWKPPPGYRSAYGPEQVHTLRNMVARHYPEAHRFICVTDDPTGLDAGVEVVPLWDDHAELKNPSFKDGPNCYRRLKMFAREAGTVFGERFVCLDLDTLITGDLRPLLNRTEDFIAWKNPNVMWPYNGSMFMLTAGARPDVWESFNPITSPAISNSAGCRGSDQGWMSYVLGRGEATWDRCDGVWSYQDHIIKRVVYRGKVLSRKQKIQMPAGARIIMFHGMFDPWSQKAHDLTPWVAEHYR